ncbi:uncharacterized protein LOC107817380 isoform X1 [Nicotiana tabacum]|uniref:Uncharacterized protein LOC107817380 isoform X1 n=2 Tax=Nicotiana TaxID=4085 RepID=A0A1S4CBR8_TOBAC|nr:PREDICTED: uncharacterized protein LOC104244432 isoform X1 [Nicotiana sylvestris]XP_016498672.1 PREDICTED: uncharacterized protein LOC107817380 isoform X1 [Nicotiana tabacum]
MNKATKTAALINSQANPFQLKASLFHSSPILERRRRTQWDSGRSAYKGSSRRSNFYSRRYRKLNSRETLFENVNAFAEQFFQGWQPDRDEYDPSSSRDSSWFRRDFRASGNKGGRSRNKGPHQQRGFQFFEDNDIEIETFFRSAFGGNKYYYWSFMNEEPQWRNSSSYSNNHRWNQRYQYSDYDESTDSENSESDLSSQRVTLGLNASGPLNLEDVKNAYRVCALKWHPDRHQGSSKAVAEEKFKACSAAYQCLCDKLALS